MFILNRKLTDYISFTIFIFLLGIVLAEIIGGECLKSEHFINCAKGGIIISLFLIPTLVFLFVNFIKNRGK